MKDNKIWLRTSDGKEMYIYKTEKCDMQKELTETIDKLQIKLNTLTKGIDELLNKYEKINDRDYLGFDYGQWLVTKERIK